MAKRTPEEIQAQREAYLAKKAARAAGMEAPSSPPPAPAPVGKPAAAPVATENGPDRNRTPEERKAQREAFLARKAAQAEGGAAPAPAPVPEGKPAPVPVASKPAAAATPKPVTAPPEAPASGPDPVITRREFLNYAWLASIGLFAVETVGLSLWFAFPNFKEGQFGGAFRIGDALNAIPEVNSGPKPYTDGKFWLVNVDMEGPDGQPRQGIMALYKVCTHLGCLYEWIPMTNRFECPCHGSKFALTGDYIAGPARRSLDRFVIQAVSPDGSIKETDPSGGPLVIEGDESLVIDTGKRIMGAPVVSAT